jgi:mannan endo-1,4-beta-mannosidase
MKTFFTIAILSAFLFSACTYSVENVNSNATKEAKELLNYIYEIQGKEVLSGQHNYMHELTRSQDSVVKYTNRLPKIWGADMANSKVGVDLRQKVVDEAKRQFKRGHIITLMYHMVRPMMHDSTGYFPGVKVMVTDEEWERITTPGTWEYDSLISKIDGPVPYLKQLQKEGIPILWRPFHEMNGMWFWYGNRPGPDGVQKLWSLMYDRYTNKYGLNNLIWVWNPNAPRDWENDEAYAYHLFYPGHDYVDILAADIYKSDYKLSHHDELLELADGKPIAIGECGRLPDPEFFDRQTRWTWFMVWAEWIWRHNEPENVRAIYDHPRVKSMELP